MSLDLDMNYIRSFLAKVAPMPQIQAATSAELFAPKPYIKGMIEVEAQILHQEALTQSLA
jgi:hypothetical protein